MRPHRLRSASPVLAGLALLGMLLTGCGDDDPGTDADEPTDEPTSVATEDDRLPDGVTCPAPIAEVEAATGWTVTDVSLNGGASGGSDGGSVAWDGCLYNTDDGGEIQASRLVDEAGDPSLTGYESVLATAVAAPEDLGTVGEGSVFGSLGNLWVSTGTATLDLHLINFDLEPEREDLVEIATAVVDGGYDGDCATLGDLLPDDVVPRGAGATGTVSDASTTYTTCRLPVTVDGQEFDLEVRHVAGTEVYDAQERFEAENGTDDPVVVEGVGDSAFQDGTKLFFAVGGQGFVVSAEDAEGVPVSAEVRAALAAVVIAHADDEPLPTDQPETSEPTEPTEPTDGETSDLATSDDFCDNLRVMFDSLDVWETAFSDEDYDALVAWAQSFQPIADALFATVPDDQAADLDVALGPIVDLADAIAVLDGSQKKAIDRAFNQAFSDTSDEADDAGDRIVESCGIDPETLD